VTYIIGKVHWTLLVTYKARQKPPPINAKSVPKPHLNNAGGDLKSLQLQ